MANRRFGWHSGSLTCRDATINNDLTIEGDMTFGDASTDSLTVSGYLKIDSLREGIANPGFQLGTYSTPYAIGSTSEHANGISVNLSATVDDDSNIIPGFFGATLTADSASAVLQTLYAKAAVNYDVADAYGVRGAISISGAPAVNQLFGLFGTVATAASTIGASGMIAALAGEVSGSADITQGGTYGKLCGLYMSWQQSGVSSVDTCAIYLGIGASKAADDGIRVGLGSSATLTNVIHTHGETGITNFLKATDEAGYVGTVRGTPNQTATCDGSIKVDINGNTLYIPLYNAITI